MPGVADERRFTNYSVYYGVLALLNAMNRVILAKNGSAAHTPMHSRKPEKKKGRSPLGAKSRTHDGRREIGHG